MGKAPDSSPFETFAAKVRSSFNGASSRKGGDVEEGNTDGGEGSGLAVSSSDAAPTQPSGDLVRDANSNPETGSEDLIQVPQRLDGQNDNDHFSEDSLDKHAFDHPSTYVGQPCIWIPRDPLGLCRVLVEYLAEAGVNASDEGATMDVKGVVEVTNAPPE